MNILKTNTDLNLVFNIEQDINVDAGWDDSFKEYEKEVLEKIINPIENYETVRYYHKESEMMLFPPLLQYDIWYYFYFNSGSTYVQDYSVVGITPQENATMTKQATESFFRLEFFKTPNDELPNRTNRRLVMTRNIALPIGERYYYTPINDYLFLPIFNGNNFRNKENMYLYWFKDDSVLEEKSISGNTFWMSAKFFNATDGSIIDFVNKNYLNVIHPSPSRVGTSNIPILFYERGVNSVEIDEENDLYYKVIIDREEYSYQIFRY